MKRKYWFHGRIIVIYTLLFSLFILSDACKDGKVSPGACAALDDEIDILKTKYFATPNVGNCQFVVKAYDNYIDNQCTDASSYVNLKDAFKADHCP